MINHPLKNKLHISFSTQLYQLMYYHFSDRLRLEEEDRELNNQGLLRSLVNRVERIDGRLQLQLKVPLHSQLKISKKSAQHLLNWILEAVKEIKKEE
jgi:hypothetical protein